MARYSYVNFTEQEIDEFRDCFVLNTKPTGKITDIKELSLVMRSLGMSPTIHELDAYFKQKGGKLTFADFLEVMHTHSSKEKLLDEITNAFKANDQNRTGMIHINDLKYILCRWGEKLDRKQVEKLFREANINGQYVKYNDFIKIICAPTPDY